MAALRDERNNALVRPSSELRQKEIPLPEVSAPQAPRSREEIRAAIQTTAVVPPQVHSSANTEASIAASLQALAQQEDRFQKKVLTPAQSLKVGAEQNLASSEKDLAECGVVAFATGFTNACEEAVAVNRKDLANKTAHAEKLGKVYESSLETKRAAEEMLLSAKHAEAQGFTQEAAAMRKGATDLLRQASDALKGQKSLDPKQAAEMVAGLQRLNQKLETVVNRAEWGERIAGGVKELAHTVGVGVGFALGGPAGSAAVNQGLRMVEGAAEESMQVALGQKTWKDAGASFLGRSQDALVESAITGVSGAAGQKVGSIVKKLQGPALAKVVDIVSSGTVQSAGTSVQIGYEYAKAHNEFQTEHGKLNGPERERAYAEFMTQRGFSLGEVSKKLGISFVAGAGAKGAFHSVEKLVSTGALQRAKEVVANRVEDVTNNVVEITGNGQPITAQTLIPALIGGHLTQRAVTHAQSKTPVPTTNDLLTRDTAAPPQPLSSSSSRTQASSPQAKVREDAAAIHALIKRADEQTLQDKIVVQKDWVPEHERLHAQMLREALPLQPSDTHMVNELRAAFEKVRVAAGLPEGVTLEPFASKMVNAYVFSAFEQQQEHQRTSIYKKRVEHTYSSEQGEGAKVFLSLGLVPELSRFVEQRAATTLENQLTALGVGASEARQTVKSLLQGESSPQAHPPVQQAAVDTFQRERHLTVDDLAAIMAHECQHLNQSQTPPRELRSAVAQSHTHEWDADGNGMLILDRAGFNPRAWERVTDFLKLESALPSRSHPSGESRSRFIAQLIADPDRKLSGLATEKVPLTVAPDSSLGGTLAQLLRDSKDRNDLITSLIERHNHPAFYDTIRGEAHALDLFERIHRVIASPDSEQLWSRFLVEVGVGRQQEEQKIRQDITNTIADIRQMKDEVFSLENSNPSSLKLIELRDDISGFEGGLRLQLWELRKHQRGERHKHRSVGETELKGCVQDPSHRALWNAWREKVPAGTAQSIQPDAITIEKEYKQPLQNLSPAESDAVSVYFRDPYAPTTISPDLRRVVDKARRFIETQRASLSIDGETPSMDQVKHGALYSLIRGSNPPGLSPWEDSPLPDAPLIIDRNLRADSTLARLHVDQRELVSEFVSTGLCEGVGDDAKNRLACHPEKRMLAEHILNMAVRYHLPADLIKHEGSLLRTKDPRDPKAKLFAAVRDALGADLLDPGSLNTCIQELGDRLGRGRNSLGEEVQDLARFQRPPSLDTINESNLTPAIATLLAAQRYSDVVTVLKDSLPGLSIPQEHKAQLRQDIVSALASGVQLQRPGALNAFADLYGVTLTGGAVSAHQAEVLLGGLIGDGIKLPKSFALSTGANQPLLAPTHPLWKNCVEVQKSLAVATWSPGTMLSGNNVSDMAHVFNCAPSELLMQLPLYNLVAEPSVYDSVTDSVWNKPIPLTEGELRSYYANLLDMHERAPALLPLKEDWHPSNLPQHEAKIALELLRHDVVPLDPATRDKVHESDAWKLCGRGSYILALPLPSSTEITGANLPTRVADWMRVSHWKTGGSDPREIGAILSHIDRAPAGTADGRSGDGIDLLIYAKNASFNGGRRSPRAQQAIARYQANKDVFPAPESAFHLAASSPYMTMQSARFVHDPESLVDSEAAFVRRIGKLEGQLDSGGLRDHLLMRELSRDLCRMTGDPFSTTRTPITTSGLLQPHNAVLDISLAETYTHPDISKIKGCAEADVLAMTGAVQPLLHAAADKAVIARLVLESFPSSTAEDRFARIQQYLPEPSPLRDHYLKRLVSEYPVTVEQVERFREKLVLDNLMRGGQGGGPAFQLLGGLSKLPGDQRQEVAKWLCGITSEVPWYLQAAAADHGVSLEGQPTMFAKLTPEEKTSALRSLLLDDTSDAPSNGKAAGVSALFAAETASDKARLRQFVGDFVAKAIDPQDPSYARIKETAELLFEHARPERRLHYFDALVQSYMRSTHTPGATGGHAETIALFLEQTGPLGCKLMQMLSHDQNLPKDLRNAFSSRRAGVQPFSVFAVSSRVNGSSSDTGARDITIERRLGTASIKQAHQATVDGERGVVKALRPTVEKYSEEDFLLCGIVTDHLRRSGLPLPKYLLDSLQEVVREESSLTHEASLQADYRQQVDGTTSRGLSISVPRVFEAHNDWAFEELASGISLAKVTDAKHYERASLAAGISLLSDITSGRRYHADLHDENIFLDAEKSKLNLIDCGAIGKAGTATLDFLKAFRREDAAAIVDILAKNNVKGDLNDGNARAALQAKLEKAVFSDAAGASLEEKANRLSYEVLDSVVPSQEIRYLIKALGVGGHHLEALKVSPKDLLSPGLLIEKAGVGLKVWWKLR